MDIQIATIHFLQIHFQNLDPVIQFLAFLGQPEFSLLVIPLIVWCLNRHLGIRLLLLISISGAICDIIKMLFHAPRPYWVSTEVRALSQYQTFGFPSGHAQNAVVFFGYIAAWMKKTWVTGLCVLFILLIGLGRIYQAVHYPLDIIGGFLIGIFLLILYIKYEKTIDDIISRLSAFRQVTLAFVISGALILCSLLALYSHISWQVPSEWFTLALQQSGVPISPLIPHDTLSGAGLFFGSATGAVLYSHNNRPEGNNHISIHILNYIIGMVILLGFWYSLKGLTHNEEFGYIIEYGRSAIAGLWITYGAPVFFNRGKNFFLNKFVS